MIDLFISEFRIRGLFGELDHTIPLREGGITFIHGPNGCGKTSVLRLITALFAWDTPTLFEMHFSEMEVVDRSGVSLIVKRISTGSEEKYRRHKLQFNQTGQIKFEYTLERNREEIRLPLHEIEEYLPFLERVGPREWIDRANGGVLGLNDVLDRYSEKLPHHGNESRPEWLNKYIQRLSLHFIKTQRLLRVDYTASRRRRPDDVSIGDMIQLYSMELKELISKKLAEQAAVSQLHDRSFPERLLSLSIDDSISESQIRAMYENTEGKIQKLVEAGLIDKQQNIALPTKQLEDTELRVLSLYLQDVNKKLSVFDDLQKKIETLLEVVGPKFTNKKFSVDRTDGFRITPKHRPDEKLAPSQLSSGEQHQIVLFYELIFKAESNAFFLIDEPEISLHVDWQRQFLGDIHKIATLGDRNFLIATHSPQIIGSHRELAVALDEGILND